MSRCVSGYIDADVLDRYLQLWLQAEFRSYDEPLVTAAEFKRWITVWHDVDPNGTWNPDGIAEGDGALVYEDECGKDVWPVVGIDDGTPLYAMSGWDWVWDQTPTKEDNPS